MVIVLSLRRRWVGGRFLSRWMARRLSVVTIKCPEIMTIAPERIEYKIALLTYKVMQGSAPRYLGPLARVADQPGRRTPRSASSRCLLVPAVRLSTVGSRVFSVVGLRAWNTLPEESTSAPSLTIFCQRLKTWLFRQSYPDLIIWTDISLTIYTNCLTLK